MVQVPLAVAPSAWVQASQPPPAHAALQHTPSAQKPEVHWLAAVQAAPRGPLGVHAPAAPQAGLGPAPAGRAVPGAQALAVRARSQRSQPPPAHAALQHTPSAQKPEVHWLAAVQAAPIAPLGVHAPVLQ